ncbi:ABC transporter substrate-binding protein [Gryllotalpicola kribbensis]|uniref:ABC transporter substrate-binding protein n=1 Tax=Gryllotalpicola kribbensis TaxID=993084 RepID=A0ABP8AR13_9MICO
MTTPTTRLLRAGTALLVAGALVATVAGCSGGSADASTQTPKGKVTIGAHSNGAAKETTLDVPEVAKIRAELPAAVRKSGELTIGVGALPAGFPPLAFTGDDQKTITGAEPDLGRLVAAVFGLKPVISNATWDNLFVGIDTGKTDIGFSNITDTEQRKEKYDFASYRDDNLALEVLKKSDWKWTGPESLAGKTVAVSSGTNQEKILLEWQKELKAEGKDFAIKYYQDANATYLALNSGKIDIDFTPNPSAAYHDTQSAKSANPTRTEATYSGAGASLQGLIAATTKKGNGLAQPTVDAINYLIENGQYAKWLAAYNLSNEAVKKSELNPPGLPLDNQ